MEVYMNAQITTARLPEDTVNKLLALSRLKNKTKSDIIKESLDFYYEMEEKELDSFTVGEGYFGNYGSGEGNRSTTYKQRIKEKLKKGYLDLQSQPETP
jgi:predicted DNA-binding protein